MWWWRLNELIHKGVRRCLANSKWYMWFIFKKHLKIDCNVTIRKEMRSLGVVPLLMSAECPRRVLLIWEVEKPTCQMLCVATSCLVMTSWWNHLQQSAPWLILSHAQLHSSSQPAPWSLLSLYYLPDQTAKAQKTHVYISYLPSPSAVFGGCPHIPTPTHWFDGIFSLAWSWRWSFSREKPHPVLGWLLTFGWED